MRSYRVLLKSVLLPVFDLCLGTSVMRELKRMEREVELNEQALLRLQQEKLRNILLHATHKVPYYRDFAVSEDLIPSLKSFPIMTKQEVNAKRDQLLAQQPGKMIKSFSSGSSGIQSMVYWTRKERSIYRATQLLWWQWAGYEIGMPLLQTGLSFNRSWFKQIKDKLFNTTYLLAFSLEPEKVVQTLQRLGNKNNVVLAGYASSLFDISVIALQNGQKNKFRTVISWGDKLFDHYRKSIEAAFGTKVYETYAATEGLMIAAQYDQPHMYIMSTHIYLELLDDSGNDVDDGVMGNVVITNLNAYGMPLIRYRTGDLAIRLPEHLYPQHRKIQLPILERVIGRDTDLVKTPNGRTLIVHSFTGIFEYFPEIKQFCIIQEHIEGITIQYIPGLNFRNDILETIKARITSKLNEPFVIVFEEVKEILPTKSGKPQIIISKLKRTT